MEICENVGQMLVEQLDTDEVQNKINQIVSDYLNKNNLTSENAENITNMIDWSVKVKFNK